jgi:hypothetical protein
MRGPHRDGQHRREAEAAVRPGLVGQRAGEGGDPLAQPHQPAARPRHALGAPVRGVDDLDRERPVGLAVVGLAQLPDRDAAFRVATAISGDGPIATAGTVGWILEAVAQLGMLLVLLGLWRARLTPIWPALLCVVGILINAVVGTMEATLIADVLLLAALGWVAILLARAPRDVWLGVAQASAGMTSRSKSSTPLRS